MVKIVFDAGAQVKFEVNLKGKCDSVHPPLFKRFALNLTTAI